MGAKNEGIFLGIKVESFTLEITTELFSRRYCLVHPEVMCFIWKLLGKNNILPYAESQTKLLIWSFLDLKSMKFPLTISL